MKRRRRGFTLIEMLMVMVILGLLSALGLLKYIDLRATARTAALAADFRSVTVAALNYYADKDEWPPETGAGAVPAGLAPYLPGGLTTTFARPEYSLDFENIPVEGSPLIAVSVTTTDPKLMGKLISTFSNRTPFFMNGGKLSYLISGPGGEF